MGGSRQSRSASVAAAERAHRPSAQPHRPRVPREGIGGPAAGQLLRGPGRRSAQPGKDVPSGDPGDGERLRRRHRAARPAFGRRLMRIGELELTALKDGEIKQKPTDAYPSTSEADWVPHQRWLTHDGMIELPIGCFLIRTAGRVVLVDAGLGRLKTPGFTGGRLLDELAAADTKPD